jgi:hypothetical protein
MLSGIPRHDLSGLRDNVWLSAKLEFELKPIRVVHRLANPGRAEAAIQRDSALRIHRGRAGRVPKRTLQ